MIIIDGETFDVPVIGLNERCDFLDKYAERTVDGKLHRELIGCYFNQQVQFGAPVGASQRAAYAALWEKLSEPEEFHEVTVPDDDGVDFTFRAYFSNVSRQLRKWKSSQTAWKSMTVNFTAEEPARTP
jgi:hypothetical protein